MIVLIGDTYYGLSDHPFKSFARSFVDITSKDDKGKKPTNDKNEATVNRDENEITLNRATIEVIVETKSLRGTPPVRVQRLFGNPEDDSDPVPLKPGRPRR